MKIKCSQCSREFKMPDGLGGSIFCENCDPAMQEYSRETIPDDLGFAVDRVWAMPSKDTFTIKPIAELLKRYIPLGGTSWVDPFAGNNSPAFITNDHNPATSAKHHLEALDFVESLGKNLFDGALFDPPYSYRQVSEHYKVIGKKATQLDTSTRFYNRVLNPLADIIKKGGYCISFGWNTNGMGKNRGFEIVEILIVAHGGHHNDTLVTVEQKL